MVGLTYNASDLQFRIMSVEEKVFVAFESIFVFGTLAAAGCAWLNRKYIPMKMKQPALVVCTALGGCFWWLGGLATGRVFPQVDNSVFLVCDLWSVWFQLVLGIQLLMTSFAYRYLRLFLIVKYQIVLHGKVGFLWFVGLWSPIWIYGIVATVFKIDGPVIIDNVLICAYSELGWIAYLILLLVYVIVLVGLGIYLRGVPHEYIREFQETGYSMTTFAVVYIVYAIILGLNLQYNVWGRIVESFLITLVISLVMYIVVGKVIYKMYKDREGYEKEMRMAITPKFAITIPSHLQGSREELGGDKMDAIY